MIYLGLWFQSIGVEKAQQDSYPQQWLTYGWGSTHLGDSRTRELWSEAGLECNFPSNPLPSFHASNGEIPQPPSKSTISWQYLNTGVCGSYTAFQPQQLVYSVHRKILSIYCILAAVQGLPVCSNTNSISLLSPCSLRGERKTSFYENWVNSL